MVLIVESLSAGLRILHVTFIETNLSFMNINLATEVQWRSRSLVMKDRLDIAKMALAVHMAGACHFWRGGIDAINVEKEYSYEQI